MRKEAALGAIFFSLSFFPLVDYEFAYIYTKDLHAALVGYTYFPSLILFLAPFGYVCF